MKTMLDSKILITGVSGTLGSELARELWYQKKNLFSLGRANCQPLSSAELPFAKMDLCAEDLGIQNPESVWKDVTCVVHCAADVRWNLPVEEAIHLNTRATSLLVQQAKRFAPKLRQFVYVSTAFVDTAGGKLEQGTKSQLSLNDFNNTYEYSKHLAEHEIVQSGVPWTIVRPSIIVGRQDTGEIDRFLSIYQLLKLYEQDLLPILVGYENAVLDFVPVDVVTNAISWSIDHLEESLGKIIYASSGEHAPTLRTVVELSERTVNHARNCIGAAPRESIKIIDPRTFDRFFFPLMKKRLPRKYEIVQQALECFRPYMRILKPRTFEAADRAFLCDQISPALFRCFTYWCQKHILDEAREAEQILESTKVS